MGVIIEVFQDVEELFPIILGDQELVDPQFQVGGFGFALILPTAVEGVSSDGGWIGMLL